MLNRNGCLDWQRLPRAPKNLLDAFDEAAGRRRCNSRSTHRVVARLRLPQAFECRPGAAGRILIDAGPAVAAIDRGHPMHLLCRSLFAVLGPRAYTCRSVLSEAKRMLEAHPSGVSTIQDVGPF